MQFYISKDYIEYYSVVLFLQLNNRTNTYNTMKDIILFPIYLIVGLGVFIFVKEIRQEIIMKAKGEL